MDNNDCSHGVSPAGRMARRNFVISAGGAAAILAGMDKAVRAEKVVFCAPGAVVRVGYKLTPGTVSGVVHPLRLDGPRVISWLSPSTLMSRFEDPTLEMLTDPLGSKRRWVRFQAIAIRSFGIEVSSDTAPIGIDLEFFNDEKKTTKIVGVRIANQYRFRCSDIINPVTFNAEITPDIFTTSRYMEFSASAGCWTNCG